ncbi:DUF6470 family protein [Peribacillus asahii]|uniref:DUF6470 family protein n=1 Tax=Peribacillus asahii TaxID=228899 RepID=UPI00207A256E|nr:DUF6470 family protein [Peribacillus asahii]USK69976.1 DUF6470 family protein [Peribacillus asahii]
MQLPQIRMQSTFIQLDIQSESPVQRITRSAPVQSIQQSKAVVNMKTTPGKLTIDQSEAWADMDIKPISQRTAEYAQKSKQKALEGIARRSRQGDELMSIEKGGNVIAAHAKENSARPQKQFNVGWIPSPGSVKMHYERAKLQFDVQTNKPIIDVEFKQPTHDYTPGHVSFSVSQKNSLTIDVVNE